MKRYLHKHFEILLLRLALYIIKGRNVSRSLYISRRDNNKLWSAGEHLEETIKRMKHNYSPNTPNPTNG